MTRWRGEYSLRAASWTYMTCAGLSGHQILCSQIRMHTFIAEPRQKLTSFGPGSIFSAFFRKGQVLETMRGNGVYQPAVDTAIEKLNKGAWVRSIIPFWTRKMVISTLTRCTSSARARSISRTNTSCCVPRKREEDWLVRWTLSRDYHGSSGARK